MMNQFKDNFLAVENGDFTTCPDATDKNGINNPQGKPVNLFWQVLINVAVPIDNNCQALPGNV